jgi:hypothetical protein
VYVIMHVLLKRQSLRKPTECSYVLVEAGGEATESRCSSLGVQHLEFNIWP